MHLTRCKICTLTCLMLLHGAIRSKMQVSSSRQLPLDSEGTSSLRKNPLCPGYPHLLTLPLHNGEPFVTAEVRDTLDVEIEAHCITQTDFSGVLLFFCLAFINMRVIGANSYPCAEVDEDLTSERHFGIMQPFRIVEMM